VGISFFTFQGLSYLIDVYREPKMASKSFSKLLLYISLFPQLIAGPIIKYKDVSDQIDSRDCTSDMTASGLRRFVAGLSKKLLIANTVGYIADSVFALSSFDMRISWLGAIAYSLQIYFDFSGYSDMAIGLGKMFGFTFMENFDYPYTSKSIREFWRRWHISLSTWFKEYLYIPLGGNQKGVLRREINKTIVFLCTGIWHGASWTFVIWGIWHGFFIILEDLAPMGLFPFGMTRKKMMWHNVYTLLVVICGFVIFRADSLTQAWTVISSMFCGFNYSAEANGLFYRVFNGYNTFIFVVAVVVSLGFVPYLKSLYQKINISYKTRGIINELSYCGAFVLFLLCVINIASSNFNPFIYFRF
jgi:alginate O-acetyltransferase complex protein AlgI